MDTISKQNWDRCAVCAKSVLTIYLQEESSSQLYNRDTAEKEISYVSCYSLVMKS